ncbi:MAG: ferritin family protein [Parcubacteria group bacterium]|jgi:rubrerythrin
MKLYICEICGDAYIGVEKPSDCPFCGAKGHFIKSGNEAEPVAEVQAEISELSKKNLLETLALETRANAIYLCMAGQAKDYPIIKMYKRLAKVELEHAIIVTKLLKMAMPEIKPEECSSEDVENFKKTIELEDHAVELYKKFAGEAQEVNIRKFFGAIMQAEMGHIELIKNFV